MSKKISNPPPPPGRFKPPPPTEPPPRRPDVVVQIINDKTLGLDQLEGFDADGVPGPGATTAAAFAKVKAQAAEIKALVLKLPRWRNVADDPPPKDGTKILVYTVHGDYELGEYYESKHEKFVPEGDTGLFRRTEEIYGQKFDCNRFERWMPLPEPPK